MRRIEMKRLFSAIFLTLFVAGAALGQTWDKQVKMDSVTYILRDRDKIVSSNGLASVSNIVWGGITGTLSNQTDLYTELLSRPTTNDSPTMADSTRWSFYEAYRLPAAGSLYGNDELVTYGKVVEMLQLWSPDVLYVETNAHPAIANAGSLWDDLSGTEWTNTYSLSVGTTELGIFLYTNKVASSVPEGVYFGTVYAKATGDATVEMYFELVVTDGSTTNVLATSGLEAVSDVLEAHNTSTFNPSNYTPTAGDWYFGVRSYAVRTGGTSATLDTYGGTQDRNTRLFIPSLNPAETTWGYIGGDIDDQTDLWTELTNRYTKAETDALVEGALIATQTGSGDDWTNRVYRVTDGGATSNLFEISIWDNGTNWLYRVEPAGNFTNLIQKTY